MLRSSARGPGRDGQSRTRPALGPCGPAAGEPWGRRVPAGSPWTGSTSAGRSDIASPRSPVAATFEAFSSHPPRRCCCRGCRSAQRSAGRPRRAASAAAAPYPCADTTQGPGRQRAERGGLAGSPRHQRGRATPQQGSPSQVRPRRGRARETHTLIFPRPPTRDPFPRLPWRLRSACVHSGTAPLGARQSYSGLP